MYKYIYLITNKINNKMYVGQTTNYKRRFSEHKSIKNTNYISLISYAIKKYGVNNFKFEVIDYGENYNDLEKYYIRYYKTRNHKYGYNIAEGGENPPVHKGENHNLSEHTYEQINLLKNDLKNSDISYEELLKKYNYDNIGTISRINMGIIWKDDNYDYPIRTNYLSNEIIDKIIYMLENTNKKQKNIAEEFGLARSTITMINIGENNSKENISYPIRKYKNISNKALKNIINKIKFTNASFKEIAKLNNIPIGTIYGINSGKSYKQKELQYPIRNLK